MPFLPEDPAYQIHTASKKTLYEREDEFMQHARQLLSELREAQKLSQYEVGKRMGSTLVTVQKVESGTCNLRTLVRYAHALGYDVRLELVNLREELEDVYGDERDELNDLA